jgi:hypothetical protein
VRSKNTCEHVLPKTLISLCTRFSLYVHDAGTPSPVGGPAPAQAESHGCSTEFEVPQKPEFQMGGGGLYGTASDYLAFERVFLNGGRANGPSVLKPWRSQPKRCRQPC